MSRPSAHSDALPAVVRRHFGLTQTELARFVGVSRVMLAHAEAGRRQLPQVAEFRLWVLARCLPVPEGQGPATPDFTAAPPRAPFDANALCYRRKQVHVAVLKLSLELDERAALQQSYERRRWAVQTLQPLLAAPAAPAADGQPGRWPLATPDLARDLKWLAEVAQNISFEPPAPLSATERALRTARLRGLEAERAALDELLGENSPAQ